MKTHLRRLSAVLTVLSLLVCSCAFAESITFNGTVTASDTYEVYAPIGGTVASVSGEAGQKVGAEDVIVSLATTKVYAEEAGVVTGIFGQPGDNTATVAEKYGAVMYLEGESVYTVSVSTANAYNATENKFIHAGEEVYLQGYSDATHTGWGVVTAIDGTSYTVRVTSGEFLVGETVNVFRGQSAAASQRIGRGTLNRTNPTAVTGSGSIVSFAVSAGDRVARGDLLFETLEGSFDGLYMSGAEIKAGVAGTISQVNAQQGGSLQKNSVVAVIYPDSAMRIEAQVAETDLASIAVGDPVSIELLWNQDEEVTYPGTITMISALADSSAAGSGDETVTYTVYIDFTPDEQTRFGMSAVVTTKDDAEEAEEAEEAEDAAAAEEAEAAEEAAAPAERGGREGGRGSRPEGGDFPPSGDFNPENGNIPQPENADAESGAGD